jgi:hypothetical protein
MSRIKDGGYSDNKNFLNFCENFNEHVCKFVNYVPEVELAIASKFNDEDLKEKTVLKFFTENKEAILEGNLLDVFTTNEKIHLLMYDSTSIFFKTINYNYYFNEIPNEEDPKLVVINHHYETKLIKDINIDEH